MPITLNTFLINGYAITLAKHADALYVIDLDDGWLTIEVQTLVQARDIFDKQVARVERGMRSLVD